MTIATIDIHTNQTVLICFVLLKYLDKISYFKLLQYYNIYMKTYLLILSLYLQTLETLWFLL